MTTSPDTMPIRGGLFIAGTGTACGKTAVAAGIIYRLQSRGIIAAGLDPTSGQGVERTAAPVSIDAIRAAFDDLRRGNDCVVVEEAGSWTTPPNPSLAFADLARALPLPVVLVVDLHPESVSRARSSARAIRAGGLNLAGWIANSPARELRQTGARLATMKELLDPAPCLGVVDHHDPATPEAVARHLRFDRLMTAMGADETLDQSNSL